jgi:N-acetyl-gamma-glutamyl-phosphate reductase
MIKVKVVGAGGYGGIGMIELVLRHPQAELAALVDIENVGKPISEVHPHLKGLCDLVIRSPGEDSFADGANVVFTATPDGVGQKVAHDVLKAGVKLIDYSGDFRFPTAERYAAYAQWIGREPVNAAADLFPKAAYGLTELHRDEIRRASIVGNPGCFAVCAILGNAPAVKANAVDLGRLIMDAKTGVSGAGIKPKPSFHYPERYDNLNAYKVLAHQHQVEVQQELGLLAGGEVRVVLVTQVAPMCRGILTCSYGALDAGWVDAKKVHALYADFYKDSPFVRLMPLGGTSATANVRGSNFCDLSLHVDQRTGTLLVVSHIDNLVKGQAGSALQNMNVMFGLDETAGLLHPGHRP